MYKNVYFYGKIPQNRSNFSVKPMLGGLIFPRKSQIRGEDLNYGGGIIFDQFFKSRGSYTSWSCTRKFTVAKIQPDVQLLYINLILFLKYETGSLRQFITQTNTLLINISQFLC